MHRDNGPRARLPNEAATGVAGQHDPETEPDDGSAPAESAWGQEGCAEARRRHSRRAARRVSPINIRVVRSVPLERGTRLIATGAGASGHDAPAWRHSRGVTGACLQAQDGGGTSGERRCRGDAASCCKTKDHECSLDSSMRSHGSPLMRSRKCAVGGNGRQPNGALAARLGGGRGAGRRREPEGVQHGRRAGAGDCEQASIQVGPLCGQAAQL